ncbi:MAG TPA: DUF4276 family protein [Kofleriaceae bacterium]|nr:DUF4276 family protein [Kofleriaceae bacterium]
MKRLLILVEGQTEERFVAEVLRDHLLARGVIAIPTILVTKRVNVGPRFKGGVSSWTKIERDLRRLLGDTSAAGITTVLDYYGLPRDAPGMASRPAASPQDRVAHIESTVAAGFGDRRFRPHLMLHELEALLFTDLDCWQHRFDDPGAIAALKGDTDGLAPEAINETVDGAPSRRITARLPHYSKVLHGPLALRDIGLDRLREACPHFASWLAWMEQLAGP